MAVKARDMVEVLRVLAHSSEEITQITVQAMGIVTTGQWGPCEARLQLKAKRQAVQWIDEPDKTGSNCVGDEDLGVKPSRDESIGRRDTLQFEVQEMELEQQPASQERKKEIQKAQLDPEEGAQEAPSYPAEETQETPPSRGGDTGGAIESREGDAGSRGGDTGGGHWIPGRRHRNCHWTAR